jgi:hypothetical protein
VRQFAFAVVLSVVSLASHAQGAPEQTPLKAQTFLSIVAREHGMHLEVFTDRGYNRGTWSGRYRREQEVSDSYWMDPFKASLAGVECTTTFFWDNDSRAPLHTSKYGDLRNNDPINGVYVREMSGLNELDELEVNWSKVAGVKRDESSTQIEIVGVARIKVPTVELATRVQYAMEFLRNACDPTAGTGF